jgi:hypothetical protein
MSRFQRFLVSPIQVFKEARINNLSLQPMLGERSQANNQLHIKLRSKSGRAKKIEHPLTR